MQWFETQLVTLFSVAAVSFALSGCRPEVVDNPLDGTDVIEDAVEELVPEFAMMAGAPPITVEIDGMTWFTSKPGPLGDPRATKGGTIRSAISSWPENLRRFGTGSNTWLNYLIRDICYEFMCGQHPQTLEIIPGLASHWWESDDHMTM